MRTGRNGIIAAAVVAAAAAAGPRQAEACLDWTAGAAATGALLGAKIGSGMGIAAFGTAAAATGPFAVAGGLVFGAGALAACAAVAAAQGSTPPGWMIAAVAAAAAAAGYFAAHWREIADSARRGWAWTRQRLAVVRDRLLGSLAESGAR